MSSEVKSKMQGSTMAIFVVGFLYTTIEKFGSSTFRIRISVPPKQYHEQG